MKVPRFAGMCDHAHKRTLLGSKGQVEHTHVVPGSSMAAKESSSSAVGVGGGASGVLTAAARDGSGLSLSQSPPVGKKV